MLTVSQAQLDILGQAKREQFEAKVVAKLRRRHPSLCDGMGGDELILFVRERIERARTYGVRKEGPVSVLIELFLAFGDSFERSPDAAWAREILNHVTLPDPLKVGLLEERLFGATAGRSVVMSPTSADDEASADATP